MIISITSGFNFGFEYGAAKRIRVDFKESFEIEDVKTIAKETFENNEFKIDYADDFKSGIVIFAKDLTDEQVSAFENKLKERYTSFLDTVGETEGEEEREIISSVDVPDVKLKDILSIYVKPIIITTIVVILFLAIMFIKQGIINSLRNSSMHNFRNKLIICKHTCNTKNTCK